MERKDLKSKGHIPVGSWVRAGAEESWRGRESGDALLWRPVKKGLRAQYPPRGAPPCMARGAQEVALCPYTSPSPRVSEWKRGVQCALALGCCSQLLLVTSFCVPS